MSGWSGEITDAISALVAGSADALDRLRHRVRERARPRFSRWAWEWIEEDFVSDLWTQLSVTARKPGFSAGPSPVAYIDACIANLCTKYFRAIAGMRRGAGGDELDAVADSAALPGARRIAAALDARRLLLALGPACRRLLTEKYTAGRSLEEIAGDEGVAASVIQSRLHDCRERARKIWRGWSLRGNPGRRRDSIESVDRRVVEDLLGITEDGGLRSADPEDERRRAEMRERLLDWGADPAEHREAIEHLLVCEDCRMEAASRDGSSGRRRRALAIAAMLLLAVVIGAAGYWTGVRSRSPVSAVSLALALDAQRGGDEHPVVRISELPPGGLVLTATVRRSGAGFWRVSGPGGEILARGDLERAVSGSERPTLAIPLPVSRLRPGAWMLIVEVDGAIAGEWAFSLER